MPEPLKNLYTEALIDEVGLAILATYPGFDRQAFKQKVFDKQWPERELKARMTHIAESLHPFMPADYPHAIEVLTTVSQKFSGFEPMFFPAFAELFGLDDFENSIAALEIMTRFSSSELAVRPFIIKYGNKMMQQMQRWTASDNEHVRRLASEGCRPRLPWAMALPEFKRDPTPVLAVIEKLMLDESEYVRRSVANNLNDISKDHPEILITMLRNRLGQHGHSDRILKHASRSLLKQGNIDALKLFGYSDPDHIVIHDLQVVTSAPLEGELPFSFAIQSEEKVLGKLRIEYAIDFMKANGKQARKIFKISEADYRPHKKQISRTHSFKRITTRNYYPGSHRLAVIINGKEFDSASFELVA